MRADAPPMARWATSSSMEAQRANGEAAAAGDLPGSERQPGNPPVFNDVEPWRVALQAGPGTLTPWPCGRSATLAGAARRNRARGHCRTTDTPQPPHWTASVKASRALSQHRLRLRLSRTASDGSPITTQLPHARPGRCAAAPGCGRSCLAAARRVWLARAVPMPCRVRCGRGGARSRRRLCGTAFSGTLRTSALTRLGAGP